MICCRVNAERGLLGQMREMTDNCLDGARPLVPMARIGNETPRRLEMGVVERSEHDCSIMVVTGPHKVRMPKTDNEKRQKKNKKK